MRLALKPTVRTPELDQQLRIPPDVGACRGVTCPRPVVSNVMPEQRAHGSDLADSHLGRAGDDLARHAEFERANSSSSAAPARAVENQALNSVLTAKVQHGAVAVWVEGDDEIQCSKLDACRVRATPGQTFELALALIALEAEVMSEADVVLVHNGGAGRGAGHGQTLRTALRMSSASELLELTRLLGERGLADGLRRLDYGNGETGAPAKEFWDEGPLAISSIEQVAFVRRLASGTLAATARSQALVRDMLARLTRDKAVLRSREGWGRSASGREVAWYVGYLEASGRGAYVAVQAELPMYREIERSVASDIAKRSLRVLGLW